MPYAVTLRLDANPAALVRRLLAALAEAGIADDVHRLGYAPHVTLAVLPDSVPAARIEAAIASLPIPILPIQFAGFGLFPGPPAVLYLAPVAHAALLHWQATLAATLPEMHAHCRPGQWVPHVTLARELTDLAAAGQALAVLQPIWRPISGQLEQIDLVRFRPVEVLSTRTLKTEES